MKEACYNKGSERDSEHSEPSRLDLVFQEGNRGRASTLQTAWIWEKGKERKMNILEQEFIRSLMDDEIVEEILFNFIGTI